jgi:6-phosphogluconate dehydrogenase
LARNFARYGYRVAVHNRTYAKTQSLIDEHGDDGEFVPSESMASFVASLQRPRRVLIMVKAGASTDAVIDDLTGLLEVGDIVIDAGNAHFPDTRSPRQARSSVGTLTVVRWRGSGAAAASSGRVS